MGWARSVSSSLGTMCVLVATSSASGSEPGPSHRAAPKALRTEYEAPAECPSQADFEWRVQARTALAVFVVPLDAGLDTGRVRVAISKTGSVFAGHLEITAPGTLGTPMSVRDVTDDHCTDVVDALALVTSLAIDPNAAVTAVIPPRPPSPPWSPLALSLPLPPDRVEAIAPRARWVVGAAFTVTTGVAPDALAGAAIYGELESDAAGFFAPSGRLGVAISENGVFQAREAAFTQVVAHADGCPGRLQVGAGVTLRACVGVDAGFVHADAIALAGPTARDPFWMDVTLLARARWTRKSLFLEVDGGLMLPLTHITFETGSGTPSAPGTISEVGKVSPVAAVASIGGGLRFP
jgi:hypothetical protein